MTNASTLKVIDNISREELYRGRARVRHIEFMKYCWQKSNEPLMVGTHTRDVCRIIDNALDRYRNGISSFLKVLICFRHGKSDMSSRYLPAHFLGEFPDDEVIVVSYNAPKAYEFSKFGRRLLRSREYRSLYPHIIPATDQQNVEEWGLSSYTGKAQYFGIGGGSAGKGGNLIIIDDYFPNRADAESETMREKTWNAFKDDIMTRRAPTCIVLLVVTPWHCDDIVARIDEKMLKDHNFPRFETARFPAFHKKYKSGTLFPERFSKEWYKTQKATLGTYSTASLMQCDPRPRTGNMLRIDKVKYYDELPEELQLARGWDIASSEKERIKDDPDYTVGAKGGLILLPTAVPSIQTPCLYIDDIVRGQWEATKRQTVMRDVAISDGFIREGIEAFAGYKDAYTELRDVLFGIRTVEKMQLPGDKVAKASCLEPICEAGNLYLRRGAPWIDDLLNEFVSFPGGKHDDIVDAVAVLYHMLQTSGLQLFTSKMYDDNKAKKEKEKEKKEEYEIGLRVE